MSSGVRCRVEGVKGEYKGMDEERKGPTRPKLLPVQDEVDTVPARE